jgi:hypothetical protein
VPISSKYEKKKKKKKNHGAATPTRFFCGKLLKKARFLNQILVKTN